MLKSDSRIYVSVIYTIIGSYNGLSAVWHQAIIWTNADLIDL